MKGKCEKLLLDFFKIVYSVVGTSQLEQQVEALQKKVTLLFKAYYEKGFSYYFDIESWIESQLTGKDFAQVVRIKRQIPSFTLPDWMYPNNWSCAIQILSNILIKVSLHTNKMTPAIAKIE